MSMVFIDLWSELAVRLHEIFLESIELPFDSLSVEVILDYLQIDPVNVRIIY